MKKWFRSRSRGVKVALIMAALAVGVFGGITALVFAVVMMGPALLFPLGLLLWMLYHAARWIIEDFNL